MAPSDNTENSSSITRCNCKKDDMSRSREFTAVILAGYGASLYPLTEPENLPKALLPIANRALLHYPLSWIESAGITNSIIVCQSEAETKILSWCKEKWKGHKPQVVSASSEDEQVGSADALRIIKDKIKTTDFIVLSVDSILEIPAYQILDFHRLQQSTVTSVFCKPRADILTPIKKGSKTFTAIEQKSSRLLYTKSEADIEGDLEIRTSLLWKFPRITLTTTLSDLHVYVFKRWILDLLIAEPKLSSLQSDLLPLLIKCQYQSLLLERYNIEEMIPDHSAVSNMSDSVGSLRTPHSSSLSKQESPIRCKVFLPSIYSPSSLCARANTTQAYIDLNRYYLKTDTSIVRISASSKIGEKSTVGSDSFLGTDSVIDEKTTIKRTIVGNNVRVGKMCKITSSIIMDGVEIGDGCKVEGSVICQNAKLEKQVTIKEVNVGGTYVIGEKEEHTSLVLIYAREVCSSGC